MTTPSEAMDSETEDSESHETDEFEVICGDMLNPNFSSRFSYEYVSRARKKDPKYPSYNMPHVDEVRDDPIAIQLLKDLGSVNSGLKDVRLFRVYRVPNKYRSFFKIIKDADGDLLEMIWIDHARFQLSNISDALAKFYEEDYPRIEYPFDDFGRILDKICDCTYDGDHVQAEIHQVLIPEYGPLEGVIPDT